MEKNDLRRRSTVIHLPQGRGIYSPQTTTTTTTTMIAIKAALLLVREAEEIKHTLTSHSQEPTHHLQWWPQARFAGVLPRP